MAGLLLVLAVATPPATGLEPAGLGDLCVTLTADDNPYFGEGMARRLEDEIRTAGRGAGADLLLAAARAQLRLGRPARALDHLSADRLDGDPPAEDVLWLRALARLQLAEDLNCVAHRGARSCLYPPSAAGDEVARRHAAAAAELLAELQRRAPRPRTRWLLGLARALAGERADRDATGSETPTADDGRRLPRLQDVAPALGLDVVDLAGGGALEDFDGDGRLDVVTSTWDPCGPARGFRNRGDGTFEDASAPWNLLTETGALNLVTGDYDNDGAVDLLLLRGAWLLGDGEIRNSLLRNRIREGEGFEDVTERVGLALPAAPTQTAAWSDIDLDGDLDLYVGNEATSAHPHRSQLWINDLSPTGPRFREVGDAAGVANYRFAKSVAWGDVDDDGDPDLYVSNFGLNRLYLNEGIPPADHQRPTAPVPRFRDVAPELGVTAPEVESFASWFFDFDNDGDLDLFVADYRPQAERVMASYHGTRFADGQPLLYRNRLAETGRLAFEEVSREIGIQRPAMPMGANFGDLDGDGWLDLFLGTGEPDLASLMPNQVYRNVAGRFAEITFAADLGHLQKGHAVAFGDLDNDGDLDLLHQLGGFYPADAFANALLRNPLHEPGAEPADGAAAAPPRWIGLRFQGRRSNRFALGARVAVRVRDPGGERRSIHRVVGGGGSFGASSQQLELGLGAAEAVEELVIRWPARWDDGTPMVQRFTDVGLDRYYEVLEPATPAEHDETSLLRPSPAPRVPLAPPP